MTIHTINTTTGEGRRSPDGNAVASPGSATGDIFDNSQWELFLLRSGRLGFELSLQ